MSDHTPGPWTVTRDGQGRRYAWIDGGAGVDAVARVTHAQDDLSGYIPDSDRIEGDSRALANADLIAAAPDLLAACEHSLAFLSALSGYAPLAGVATRALTEMLKRAIATARGAVTP